MGRNAQLNDANPPEELAAPKESEQPLIGQITLEEILAELRLP